MTGLELLEFARGPALWASVGILLGGTLWRISGILRLGVRPDLAVPRSKAGFAGALRGITARMVPHRAMRHATGLAAWNGYLYHVGLAVIVFAYVPHIEFVRRLTGVSWAALPEPVVFVFTGITFVAMFIALLMRLSDPVRRLLSRFDDYFSWAVVLLPLVTGMSALSQSYASGSASAVPLDPMPVAIHLLSVELLFVWLPFGKLAHAFLVFASRGATGAAQARKGAAL
jgi:nitrate reductase gamma subunit